MLDWTHEWYLVEMERTIIVLMAWRMDPTLGLSVTADRSDLSRYFRPDSVSGIGECHNKMISTMASSTDESIDGTLD